jgi:hypothetical protein
MATVWSDGAQHAAAPFSIPWVMRPSFACDE